MLRTLTDTLAATAGRLNRDDRGGTAIEYSLVAALVALAIIAAISAVGGSSGGSWGKTADKAGQAMNGS